LVVVIVVIDGYRKYTNAHVLILVLSFVLERVMLFEQLFLWQLLRQP